MTGTGTFLIWSHKHGRWWGPGGCGYVRRIAEAGRYSRAEALQICTRAIPGTAHDLGALPEIPVCLADIEAMQKAYCELYSLIPEVLS